jgi:transcriptional antiterminator RfaH
VIEVRWYAVRTKPHQEKQSELSIKLCGIECFLPLMKENKIVRRVRKTVVGPLFPGYLFVRIDVAEQYRAVTYARGVRTIVMFGSKPAEVDPSVIDAIKNRMTSSYIMETRREFRCGQTVKIGDGPLGGLEAVFMYEMPGKDRAMLLLKTMAFHAKVVVNIEQLSSWVVA